MGNAKEFSKLCLYTKKDILLLWKKYIYELYIYQKKKRKNFKKNKEIIELKFDLSDTVNFEKNINELKVMLKGISKKIEILNA